MGLDYIEIIMNIEETFDITIPNEVAERHRTVGDLYRYILEHIAVEDSPKCLSSAAFYRVRRVLMVSFQSLRSNIRPSSRLEDLIPREDRKSAWQRLATALDLSLPDLERPPTMRMKLYRTEWLMFLLTGLSLILMAAGKINNWIIAGVIVNLILGEILLLILIHRRTQPYALEFAPSCRTIRGLVEILVDRDRERTMRRRWLRPGSEEPCWNEVKVWETLRGTFVGQWGIDPEAVTEDARIIDFD